ncbi:MAG: hypothetical protein ACIPMY_02040, partial [Rickettsia endosymbiont of Pentastiridius leporinus]
IYYLLSSYFTIKNYLSTAPEYHAMDIDENNNPIAATHAPIATPVLVAPANATSPSEEKLSAEIKSSLYNGENKEDLINFVLLYQGISDEARDNLVNYICDYSHATELAGQIGADIQF